MKDLFLLENTGIEIVTGTSNPNYVKFIISYEEMETGGITMFLWKLLKIIRQEVDFTYMAGLQKDLPAV